MSNEAYVLDSFAVLALLGGEEGGAQVLHLMRRAEKKEVRLLMTWVNVGEVACIVERRWGKRELYHILATLEATAVELVAVGRELAVRAAGIKARHPLAYADAFAAALAMKEHATLVTGDPELKRLEGTVNIQWLPHGE